MKEVEEEKRTNALRYRDSEKSLSKEDTRNTSERSLLQIEVEKTWTL